MSKTILFSIIITIIFYFYKKRVLQFKGTREQIIKIIHNIKINSRYKSV